MTTRAPRRTIVICLVATLAINVVKTIRRGDIPAADLGIGAALSGTLLLVLTEWAPTVASGLAVVMLITAAGGRGDDAGLEAVRAIGRVAGGEGLATRPATAASTGRSGLPGPQSAPGAGQGAGGGGGRSW